MRIGIEAQRIFRPKKHGMDIVALEMIRALQEIDTENHYFIFVKPDLDRAVLSSTSNFEIVEISGGPYPYWEQVLLPKAAQKLNIDVLHCTSNTAPLFCNIPLVLTLHDIIYLENLDFSKGTWYQRFGNLYRRLLVPKIVRNCQKIITVSNYEKEIIQAYFNTLPKERIIAIHNAAGKHFSEPITDAHIQRIRSEFQLPDNYVFFLGNTDPKKNVIGVMKALKEIKLSGKLNFKLVMPDYNKEHLLGVLKEIEGLDLLHEIQLTGYINNKDLPVLYHCAKLFIYPSLRESFGIPILESMACGTVVLTSKTASMPEVAGDAAYYCDPKDYTSIATAWILALEDKQGQQSIKQLAKERVKKFDWKLTAGEVLNSYLSIR